MAQVAPRFRSVMLIDDNEIDNLINQKMIEASGISGKIMTHTSAKAAIETLKNLERLGNAPTDFLPEIIFLDIDMPLMDGFQFLDEFEKQSDAVKNYCKVIMLTSSLNPMDISKAKKNPYVSQYINKPLSHDTLLNLSV